MSQKAINLSVVKTGHFIIIPAASLLLAGCASTGDKEMAVEQLNRQVAELRQSLEETNSRVEDISNKFDLLHKKMEAARTAPQGGFTPHEGLKVVRLGEEGQR